MSRRTGDLEYLNPVEPAPKPAVARRNGAAGAWLVVRLGVSVTVLVGEPEPTPSGSPS